MTGNKFELPLLIIAAMMIAQAPAAAAAGDSPKQDTTETAQQQGMEDNLEDSIPQSDLDEQHGLENPRIVIPENLQEMPEVKAVSDTVDSGDTSVDEASGSTFIQKTEEELEQFENELQLEAADRSHVLLDTTDRMMEISRKPLTYIQENVPFLTKRGIIFFGRLELDGAYYSSGVLKDDN